MADDERVTQLTVLDHRTLFRELRDAPCTALNTAMPSPMPPVALIAMPTIVTDELTRHLVEAI